MGKKSLINMEKEIAQLPRAQQLWLMEKLIHRMQRPASRTTMSWDELYGLGEGVWHGQDAQAFVNELREDRA